MSINNFSADLFVISVNTREISDWGETDPAYSDAPIDPTSVLRRGQRGRAIRLDRSNPGRAVTLNLNPGSPDSAYMSGLFASKANMSVSKTQIGTLEAAVGTEGIIANDGSVDRAGATTISDDQYILEFNGWTATKGGE